MVGWVRSIPDNGEASQAAAGNDSSTSLTAHLESSFMSCCPSLQVANFSVTVDSAGYVLESERLGDFDQDVDRYLTGNASDLFIPHNDAIWHNSTTANDWNNYLITLLRNSSSTIDPSQPPPNIPEMIPVVQDLYKRVSAALLGTRDQVFLPAAANTVTNGHSIHVGIHIFMSKVMFVMTMVLLSLNILVALAYYICRPKWFLPRMPTTIASILAYVSPSTALAEWDPQYYGDDDVRYGFGEFVGVDGKAHIGIERHQLLYRSVSTNRKAFLSS